MCFPFGQGGLNGMIGIMGFGMILLMILFVVVIGFIIYGAIRLVQRETPGRRSYEIRTDKSFDVVRERYARGEIDADTYKKIMDDLK